VAAFVDNPPSFGASFPRIKPEQPLFWLDAGSLVGDTIVNLVEHSNWLQTDKLWCLRATVRGWGVFVFEKLLALVVSSPI